MPLIWRLRAEVTTFLSPSLSLCRSVISYKTDQKPLFSTDTVANAGWWLMSFFFLFVFFTKI